VAGELANEKSCAIHLQQPHHHNVCTPHLALVTCWPPANRQTIIGNYIRIIVNENQV